MLSQMEPGKDFLRSLDEAEEDEEVLAKEPKEL